MRKVKYIAKLYLYFFTTTLRRVKQLNLQKFQAKRVVSSYVAS